MNLTHPLKFAKPFLAVLSLSAATLAFASSPSLAQDAPAENAATVTQVQGEVFVQAAGSAPDQWQAAAENAVVKSGDSLKTGNGTCSLVYGDQGTFKVTPNTTLTVQNNSDTQNILLQLGKIQGSVDSTKTVRPFQVVTAVAVSAVRGTDVDFELNEDGELIVDLHDGGPVQVFNDDAELSLDLEGIKKILLKFNKETGELTITNDCASGAAVTLSIGGTEHSLDACGSQTFTVELETAAGETEVPETVDGENTETVPNEEEEPLPLIEEETVPDPVSPIEQEND